MKWLFNILGLCGVAVCFASANPHFFEKFPNTVFVETGSFDGGGISKALLCGFKEVYSIEIDQKWYLHCKEKFQNNTNVALYYGDSSDRLFEMIESIDEPITFWLDGHYSGAIAGRGVKNSPILEELEQIKAHNIKTHTILVDDVRFMGTKEFDYVTLQEIMQAILEINPNYKFSFYWGAVKGDILAATI